MTPPVLPTDSELEILKVLWEKQPCSVREVHDSIVRDGRPLAYTTVLKLMQIMTEKQLVLRDSSSRAHLYRAAAPRPKTQKQMVDDLLNRAFQGAASELVLHALSGRKSTPEELAEIRRLLDQLEKSSDTRSGKSSS
jgi:predicted transcriptional regulator